MVPEEAPAYLSAPGAAPVQRCSQLYSTYSDARLPTRESKMSVVYCKSPSLAPGQVSRKSGPFFDLRRDPPDLTSWKASLARHCRFFPTASNPRAIRCSKFWERGFVPGIVSSEKP